jgi:hypothetical protein
MGFLSKKWTDTFKMLGFISVTNEIASIMLVV